MTSNMCQSRIKGRGMPCLVDINTLAGLQKPCEVCEPSLQKMRDMMGWKPFRYEFYMTNKLTSDQHDRLLDRINEHSYHRIRKTIGDVNESQTDNSLVRSRDTTLQGTRKSKML